MLTTLSVGLRRVARAELEAAAEERRHAVVRVAEQRPDPRYNWCTWFWRGTTASHPRVWMMRERRASEP